MTDATRTLKIKTGSVARLAKELGLYSQEAASAADKVAAMRAAGEDAHDVKHAVSGWWWWWFLIWWERVGASSLNALCLPHPPHPQENVAAESALMVPDTRTRLEAAVEELKKALVRRRERVGNKGGRRGGRPPGLTHSPSAHHQDDVGGEAEGTPELAAARDAVAAAEAKLAEAT